MTIRIRAERRLGEMLGKAKESGSLREGRPETVAPDDSFTLAEAGISRDLSSRSQAIAVAAVRTGEDGSIGE